ncbi:baseplate protein [Mesorhizobium sp. LSJC269B00]|uniref:GPW/gp25 family protein n=1 Tax=Mesorhizobium sp. LSJC269B00 TaxID=1287326 RepID=UPI0003CE35C8|nr:GPW/gp25 family protein [Mesorhizobium sp. LSJC269B00]ESW93126.1 baseplate protein [Mesorhizobium sp. LSJC269B00]
MSDFLGKGPSFPSPPWFADQAGPKRYGFKLSEGEDKIKHSLWLILATAPGERVMRADFGCGIHELPFEPVTPALTALVVDRVRTALTRWEPRIDLLKIDVQSLEPNPECLLIDITYRLRANNAVGNMVYPFYLQEGAA